MQIDVRALRKSLSESQSRFGELFGVDQSTVHRWEKEGLPVSGVAKSAVEKFAAENSEAAQ